MQRANVRSILATIPARHTYKLAPWPIAPCAPSANRRPTQFLPSRAQPPKERGNSTDSQAPRYSMQIRFAAKRPSGDHALVLPIAGAGAAALDSVRRGQGGDRGGDEAPALRGRSGRPAAEHYLDSDGGRRLLLVGTGKEAKPDSAEQLGGAVTAKLLTSGEREAVIDLGGAGSTPTTPRASRLGATLRAWRHDRYRTRLEGQAPPDARPGHHRRRARRRRGALDRALRAAGRGRRR